VLDEGWRTNDLARLKEARADADSAIAVADNGASQEVREQARHVQTEIKQRITRAEKNRVLLTALLDVSDRKETPIYKDDGTGRKMALPQKSADEQYSDAFRRWGLDIDRTEQTEVIARLQDEPEQVRQEIIAALDAWMLKRRGPKHPRNSGDGYSRWPKAWTATIGAGNCGRGCSGMRGRMRRAWRRCWRRAPPGRRCGRCSAATGGGGCWN
jgi:hypothetical protein